VRYSLGQFIHARLTSAVSNSNTRIKFDVLIGCRIYAARSTGFVALSDRNALPIPSSDFYLANLIYTERLRVTEASALLTETLSLNKTSATLSSVASI